MSAKKENTQTLCLLKTKEKNMEHEKAIKITEQMVEVFDAYIREIDMQISESRNLIRKHRDRLDGLEDMRDKAETTRTIMVECQSAIF